MTKLTKPDFKYPLPSEALHARYDGVFDSINRGQSVTLIGLPESSRSAYFKFIVQNPDVTPKFIDPSIYKFVYIDKSDLSLGKLGRSLIVKIAYSGILESNDTDLLTQESNLSDLILATHKLCQMLDRVKEKKLVIVFYEAEEILLADPEFILLLHKIWCLRRFQPDSLTNFVFICSPNIVDIKTDPTLNPLRSAFEESVVYFPLFNDGEMNYHRNRIEYFTGEKISDNKDELIRKFADGHAVAYKILFNLSEDEINKAIKTSQHTSVSYLTEKIWSSLPKSIQSEYHQSAIVNNGILKSLDFFAEDGLPRLKFLPPHKDYKEEVRGLTLPRLTAQEHILYEFLSVNNSRVVSRDEVADAIWGKNVDAKYSDWAIDQVVHKLRKKLQKVDMDILTHRNRGYQLIEN